PRDRRATLVQITPAGVDRVNEVSLALESPGGELAVFDGMHREIFEALQPARLAAGDVERLNALAERELEDREPEERDRWTGTGGPRAVRWACISLDDMNPGR